MSSQSYDGFTDIEIKENTPENQSRKFKRGFVMTLGIGVALCIFMVVFGLILMGIVLTIGAQSVVSLTFMVLLGIVILWIGLVK